MKGSASRRLATGSAGITALACLALAGCVSAEPRDRAPPKQPQWARPTTMLVSTSFPEDSDGNGYFDTMGVTVYLFDDQFAVAPIQVPGTFSFTLTGPDGQDLATWTLPPDRAAAAVRAMPPGPGYVIRLSLLEGGTDRTTARNAELYAVFSPAEGEPVRAKALTVTVGRSGLRPSGTP